MNTAIVVLPEINTVPALIEFDFEATKLRLESRLEPFKTVVTEDTIVQAKAEKAEINKLKAAIDDARKIEAAKATASVRLFEDQMKALVKLCAEGYAHLNDQINKFEAVTKSKCLAFLRDDLLDAWESLGVDKEFRKGTVDHLALLGNCNDAGIPNKKTKKAVIDVAERDIHAQTKTALRLSQLEAECFKAGLKIPLSRVHVNGFLFASDEQYAEHLAELIAEEIERTKKADALFFDEPAEEVAQVEPEPTPGYGLEGYGPYGPQESYCSNAQSAEPEEIPVGKLAYTVTVLIEVSVDPHITPVMIEQSARKQMIEKAGFKNIKSIDVHLCS